MNMNGKFYYKIDVHSRSDGYSFMVRSDDELSDDEAIRRALAADCFNDEEDADAATVDTLIDENDIEFFADSTYDVAQRCAEGGKDFYSFEYHPND